MVESPWPTFEEWREYGIDKGYDKRSPRDLLSSEGEQERSWYRRGTKKGKQGWLKRFPFNRICGKTPWHTYEEWKLEGINRGFDGKTSEEVRKSEERSDRSWYCRGKTMKEEGWLNRFQFKNRRRKWEGKDPLKYFKERYSKDNLTRSDLARIDSALYDLLAENNLLEVAIPECYGETYRGYKTPLDCFRDLFGNQNITRGQLQKKDKNLYSALRNRNQLEEAIPTKSLTPNQFLLYLKQNPPAKNAAMASVVLNGSGADMEELIVQLSEGRIKDTEQAHRLIQETRDELYQMIREGMTNLGYYVGDFSVIDKPLVPVLIDQVVDSLPKGLNVPLEEKFGTILRAVYSPRFNEDSDGTLAEIRAKTQSSQTDKTRKLYQGLQQHYEKVKSLEEALG